MKLCQEIINKKEKIAVVGLGYVGLPLALEFGKIVKTIGFDLNGTRIKELKANVDRNNESSIDDLKAAKMLEFTSDASKLKEAKFIIVAVPTPINRNRQPDLFYVSNASEIVGKNLSKGSIVVFESTVYPGVTEEVCLPIIKKFSGLKYGRDFKMGYSPERINPGDKEHTVTNIVKVVSGSDAQALEEVAGVYSIIVKAGVFRAENIKTAEAAKVIENTQRDLNIALMNELSLIFRMIGVDTQAVLKAAGTKWNFIKMQPGLVGGHCIGVDPYYLTYKAEELGYHPEVILAGRRINDNMGKYVAEQTAKQLIAAGRTIKGSKVMMAGITFKENVSDIRNSKVVDIVNELHEYGIKVIICDPLADKNEVKREYGLLLTKYSPSIRVDGIVFAVNHAEYKRQFTPEVIKGHFARKSTPVVIDLKGMFDKKEIARLKALYWRL